MLGSLAMFFFKMTPQYLKKMYQDSCFDCAERMKTQHIELNRLVLSGCAEVKAVKIHDCIHVQVELPNLLF